MRGHLKKYHFHIVERCVGWLADICWGKWESHIPCRYTSLSVTATALHLLPTQVRMSTSCGNFRRTPPNMPFGILIASDCRVICIFLTWGLTFFLSLRLLWMFSLIFMGLRIHTKGSLEPSTPPSSDTCPSCTHWPWMTVANSLLSQTSLLAPHCASCYVDDLTSYFTEKAR